MKKALWRRFDAATPKERRSMVSFHWELHDAEDRVRYFKASPEWNPEPNTSIPNDVLEVMLCIKGDTGETHYEPIEYLSDVKGITITTSWISGFQRKDEIQGGESWILVVEHDATWIRLRNSFYRSREWKEFRAGWLKDYPTCVKCGRMQGVMQVHHAGDKTLDMTVLTEGFLDPLKDRPRFETMCYDCHEDSHKGLIAGERKIIQARTRDRSPCRGTEQ